MLVTETPASKWNISQYFELDDLHSTTNEIYLSYFTLDSLKHTLPYYFYLVERFLKLSSNFVWATPGMSCDVIEWDLFVPVSLNSDRFTVPSEPLCPGLPYHQSRYSCHNHLEICYAYFFILFFKTID